jgi:hypothetical protein
MMTGRAIKKIWIVFFIAAAAGTFIIVWLLRPGAGDASYPVGDPGVIAAAEEDIFLEMEEQEEPQKEVPRGLKEVNLPVSFFGDDEALGEGDKVDIISTYYKEEAGSLFSERIITASEIIRLNGVRNLETEDSLTFSDVIISDGISGTVAALDMGNILVLTLFLTDDEVLKSFTALESGMLYIALCPAGHHPEWKDD